MKGFEIFRIDRSIFFGCLFLVLINILIYGQTLGHDFLNYDDDKYITQNPHVLTGLNFDNTKWAFSTTHSRHWHPLTWLSHMMDGHLFGKAPGGHHLSNLLFHIINTILLFYVLQRCTGAFWCSFFVAALFAVHPLHVQSVAWISDRKDLLSTFFALLAVRAYIRFSEKPAHRNYLWVVLFFILGLLSKPIVITLPLILILLDFWPLDRFKEIQSGTVSLFRLIWEKIVLFLIAFISGLVTIFAMQIEHSTHLGKLLPSGIHVTNALYSYVGYILKMFYPVDLTVHYFYPGPLPVWKILVTVILLIGISIFIITVGKKRPYLFTGWFWYLITLLPVAGFIGTGPHRMADRFTYIPLIGLFIVIVWSFREILKHYRYGKIIFLTCAGLVISVLSMMATIQTGHWQNSRSLFEHALKINHRNFLAHNNLGMVYWEEGETDRAVFHFREALRFNPNYVRAQFNLGNIYLARKDLRRAVLSYQKAIRKKPTYKKALNNLGYALMLEGKFNQALKHFDAALKIDPQYTKAQKNRELVTEAITRSRNKAIQ